MIGAFSFFYGDSIPCPTHNEFDKNANSFNVLVFNYARILNWFGDYRSLRFLCGYFGSRTFYFIGDWDE